MKRRFKKVDYAQALDLTVCLSDCLVLRSLNIVTKRVLQQK